MQLRPPSNHAERKLIADIPYATRAYGATDGALGKVKLDVSGRIDEDISCRKCGYNLRTLMPDGRCPECGTAVGRSIQGDYLRFCDPDWVQRLASGMNWIVASIVIGVCGGLGLSVSGAGVSIMPVFIIALGIVPLVGYWLVTTPDPAKLDESSSVDARKLVRVTQVLEFGLGAVTTLPQYLGVVFAIALTAVNQIVAVVGFFAIFIYARKLALRIPDEKLGRHCRIVMWGLVIATCLAIVFGIIVYVTTSGMAPGAAPFAVPATGGMPTTAPAPTTAPPTPACGASASIVPLAFGGILFGVTYLVFGIWSLILILRFRKALAEASRLALATWAAENPGGGP